MKTLNCLLVAAAAAVTLSLAPSAFAGEPFLSPRARDLQPHAVAGNSSVNDPDLMADRPVGNAKAETLARSLRTVPGAGNDMDLAHAARPALSAKDPRYDIALRENAAREFQIAPLK